MLQAHDAVSDALSSYVSSTQYDWLRDDWLKDKNAKFNDAEHTFAGAALASTDWRNTISI
ncbi:hypothetical protein KUC_0088 [Vreelandella boliviensis LC1]|uniref:Uncharacterized protein n=1 Tax=Vreelandella boliviensis LC1 TaxID=1072583 RepID=A0A265DWU5_9GAMM|nr:hypothetical protein KUC_0088 [Halomonas boliviensis LC1]OZT73755.1 hypothetical protein CE457_12255 [Halomonas boliviensis LC1]